MELTFANNKLEKTFSDFRVLKKTIGSDMAKKVKSLLDVLEQLKNIGELMRYPIGNPHFLKENMYGFIAWTVLGQNRLILDIKTEKYGSGFKLEDCNEQETLEIKGIGDYHGNKMDWIIN